MRNVFTDEDYKKVINNNGMPTKQMFKLIRMIWDNIMHILKTPPYEEELIRGYQIRLEPGGNLSLQTPYSDSPKGYVILTGENILFAKDKFNGGMTDHISLEARRELVSAATDTMDIEYEYDDEDLKEEEEYLNRYEHDDDDSQWYPKNKINEGEEE